MNFSDFEQLYFYSNYPDKPAVFTEEFVLDEEVDDLILKRSLEDAVFTFPRLSMKGKVSEDFKRVDLVKNDAPLPLFGDDLSRTLGSAETNRYFYYLSAYEKTVKMAFFHALADGRASFEMSTFIIERYMYYRGYSKKKTDFKAVYEDIAEAAKGIKPLNKAGSKDSLNMAFDSDTYGLFDKNEYAEETLTFDWEPFHKACKDMGATPVNLTIMLLSDILHEKEGNEDKDVVCGISVDTRPIFGSESMENMSLDMEIVTGSRDFKLSDEERAKIIKDRIKEGVEPQNMANTLTGYMMMTKATQKMLDLKTIEKVLAGKRSNDPTGGFFLSNVGKINLSEESSKHVKELYFYPAPTKKEAMITMYTYNGKVYLIGSFNYENSPLIREFKNKLEEKYNIRSSIQPVKHFKCDRMSVLELMKE